MNKPELIEAPHFYELGRTVQSCHEIIDPQIVVDPRFRVTDIPGVMRNVMNWPKSAELMELWFSLPAKEMSPREKKGKIDAAIYPSEYTNTTMFTWEWLEQFESVQKGLNKLKATLDNKAAKNELSEIFYDYIFSNKKATYPLNIQNRYSPQALHFPWHYQHATIEYQPKKSLDISDSIDDLYGSLGNFGLYAAITKGKITKLSTRHTSNSYLIHISEVAIYMRDTYDFIGSQYLGHWEDEGLILDVLGGFFNSTSVEYTMPFVGPNGLVEAFGNEDFRKYRSEKKLGGDILLFSDIKTVPVNITIGVLVPS